MKNKPENPQAFACIDKDLYQEGMTLRDYFAAKALSIVPTIAKELYENIETWEEEDYAKEAYKIADAMLAERSKSDE